METYYSIGGYSNKADSQLQFLPNTFLRSGLYRYYIGDSNGYINDYGYYWQSGVYSITTAWYLTFASTFLLPQYNVYNKGDGSTLRCLVR